MSRNQYNTERSFSWFPSNTCIFVYSNGVFLPTCSPSSCFYLNPAFSHRLNSLNSHASVSESKLVSSEQTVKNEPLALSSYENVVEVSKCSDINSQPSVHEGVIISKSSSKPLKKLKSETYKVSLYELMQCSPQRAKTSTKKHASAKGVELMSTRSCRRGVQKEHSNKRPTTLKKIILKERENHKQMSMADWQSDELKNEENGTDAVENIKAKLHNKRFREYCNHLLTTEIDEETSIFLKCIARFQQRAYESNPVKARYRRRFVIGIKETTKHLRLGRVKCAIVAPNCEYVSSEGGLDEAILRIVNFTKEQNVLCVFALNRKKIGLCLNLKQPVSVVGVIDYSGAEVVYKKLLKLVDEARDSYEMKLNEIMELSKKLSSLCLSESNKIKQTSNAEDSDNDDVSKNIKGHSRNLSDSFNLKKRTHARNSSGNFDLHTSTTTSLLSDQRLISHSRNASSVSDVSRTSQPLSDISPYCEADSLLHLQNEYHSRVNTEFGCENVLSSIEEFDTGNEADSENVI